MSGNSSLTPNDHNRLHQELTRNELTHGLVSDFYKTTAQLFSAPSIKLKKSTVYVTSTGIFWWDGSSFHQLPSGVYDSTGQTLQGFTDGAGNFFNLSKNPSSLRIAIKSALGNSLTQNYRSGDSIPIWQSEATYTVGQRIFPTAYTDPITFTTGFQGVSGAPLYCLMCVSITTGISSTIEPAWKAPSTITNWSIFNSGTSTGQLDIVDGGVTWRARPVFYVDPITGSDTISATNGTQVHPYASWGNIVGTATGASPYNATVLNVYNDTNLGSSSGSYYAGAAFVQRVNTTITSAANQPIITIPGANSGTQNSYTTNASTIGEAGSTWQTPVRLTFGSYRVPGDNSGNANLVGAGITTNSNGNGVIQFVGKMRFEVLDFAVTSAVGGDLNHGVYGYWTTPTTLDGNARVHFAGINSYNCIGGSGIWLSTNGGSSTDVSKNGILIEDSNFFNNQGHGSMMSGNISANIATDVTPTASTNAAYGMMFNRCKAWGNGSQTAIQAYNHGFSNIAFRQIIEGTGWTNTSGFIYSHAIGTPPSGTLTTINKLYSAMIRSNGSIWPAVLQLNIDTPTTPGVGQFGFSGSTVYVNLGNTLSTSTEFRFQFAPFDSVVYNNCESFNNNTYLNNGVVVEGHGFAADELSSITLNNCYSHDNQGSGVLFNESNNAVVNGGVYYNNGRSGVYISCGLNCVSNGALILNNNFAGFESTNGSVNTNMFGNHIGYHTNAAYFYQDATTPYPVPSWPLHSGVIGGNNTLEQNTYNYVSHNLATGANSYPPLLQGDFIC